MKPEDKEAFDRWWDAWHDPLISPSESRFLHAAAKAAWTAAIEYEQDKPIRTYRWDGVIR